MSLYPSFWDSRVLKEYSDIRLEIYQIFEYQKSLFVWALVNTCWSNYTHIHHIQNGFYSAIPYTCLAVMAIMWGQVTDLLRQRKLVATTAIRKLNSVLGKQVMKWPQSVIYYQHCGYFLVATFDFISYQELV